MPNQETDLPNIQVLSGAPIEPGFVALLFKNMPIQEVNGELLPCIQVSARQAMELAMNIIHIAKIAENSNPT